MKENIMATNFDPHEYVILVQSTKIGTHENKAIHSIKIVITIKFSSILIKVVKIVFLSRSAIVV